MPETPALFVMITVALVGAGCSGLPIAGPLASDIVSDSASGPAKIDYVLVDVSEAVCQTLAERPVESFQTVFGTGGPPGARTIGIGDSLSISIWEAGSGGLFSGAVPINQIAPASRGVTLPELVVAEDGKITIPFAGRIVVNGKLPADVEEEIAAGLKGKAVDPQIVVTVARSIDNTVAVSGEVGSGARVPLGVKGDRILDAIAAAGGVRIPVNEAVIRLTRGERTASVSYDVILQHPAENAFLRAGDVLTVVRSPQTFTAFGAVGRNFEIPFEADSISAEEAIAKAGGFLDQRADPSGLFVFRFEPEALVHRIAPGEVAAARAGLVPVVYRLNMKDAGSYFLAREFAIRNKDIVYAANAPLNELQKFLALIGAALGPAATSAAVGSSVKTF